MENSSEEAVELASKLIVKGVGFWSIIEINGKFGCFWRQGIELYAEDLLAYNLDPTQKPEIILVECDDLDKAHAWCLIEMKKELE